MGQITSYLWPDTGRTDDPDPVTNLTSRDRYFIRTTWTNLTKNQTVKTGVLIFMTLFKKRPEYKDLFPFRDIPMEELPANKRFQAHCVTVVYALTSMVNNIEVPDLLQELLLKQGAAHVPRGVPEEAYEVLKESLTDIFTTAFTKEQLAAWDKFLTMAVQVLLDGARSAQK